MNELVKERNEIAKQMCVRNPSMNSKSIVLAANFLMDAMYGDDWEQQPSATKPSEHAEQETPAPTNTPFGYAISIVDCKGAKWVRVKGLGEDFIIAPHDLTDNNGDVMINREQPELIKRLKELNLDTFNRKQGFIIATLIEEINAKLVKAGGDKFAQDWYASSELWRPVDSSDDCISYTWYFSGSFGCFNDSSRYVGSFRSRPVLKYKWGKFRC